MRVVGDRALGRGTLVLPDRDRVTVVRCCLKVDVVFPFRAYAHRDCRTRPARPRLWASAAAESRGVSNEPGQLEPGLSTFLLAHGRPGCSARTRPRRSNGPSCQITAALPDARPASQASRRVQAARWCAAILVRSAWTPSPLRGGGTCGIAACMRTPDGDGCRRREGTAIRRRDRRGLRACRDRGRRWRSG